MPLPTSSPFWDAPLFFLHALPEFSSSADELLAAQFEALKPKPPESLWLAATWERPQLASPELDRMARAPASRLGLHPIPFRENA